MSTVGRAVLAWLPAVLSGCSLLVDVPGVSDELPSGPEVRRKRIEITSPLTSKTIGDYPVAVIVIDDEKLAGRATPDNIAFTGEQGEPLPFELEFMDTEAGTLGAWVLLPELVESDAGPTVIYLRYGGEPFRRPEPGETWPAPFVGVWHLTGDGPEYIDSTFDRSAAHLSSGGSPVSDLMGGLVFDGNTTLQVDDTNVLDFGAESFTYSAWVRIEAADFPQDSIPLSKGGLAENNPGYSLRLYSTPALPAPPLWEGGVGDGTNLVNIGFGDSTLFVDKSVILSIVVDRDVDPNVICAYGIHSDGEENSCADDAEFASVTTDDPLILGDGLVGRLDEVRIYNGPIDPERLIVEHRNLTNPESMIRVGPEEMLE